MLVPSQPTPPLTLIIMLQRSFLYRKLSTAQAINNGEGSGNGEFWTPSFIVFDPYHNHLQPSQPQPKILLQQEEEKQQLGSKNGCIIVSDDNNYRLQWFDRPTLRHLISYGEIGTELGKFYYPSGLCLQPITNRLVVCDTLNHRVQILSLDDDNVPFPVFAIGRKPIYDANRLSKPSKKKGEFHRPSGVCCSPDGGIFIADNHLVQSFDAGGRFLSTFGSHGDGDQELNRPFDVCLVHRQFSPSSLASGMLCVADYSDQRVSVCSSSNTGPSSSYSSSRPQHLFNFKVAGTARGLCVDLKGYLHVSCGYPSHVISIYDFRMVRSTNFTTKFYAPTGMCVDSCNTLMVVDSGNDRVQFFEECQ